MAKIANIKEVSVDKLIPYENNAKIHGDEQVKMIADSINEFGFISPCIIDKDYNIIAGHGRVLAAKLLGMESVPCLFVEGLTEAQRKAYILADNRLTEMGEWDLDKVKIELQYNPNVVFTKEIQLLKLSLLKQGWIQPILVTQDYVIIDGFHRATLAKTEKDLREMTGGKVPVVIMNLSEPERMLLTIRMNRAKGSHIAVKMSDIIKTLVNEYGMPVKQICKEIGATKDEVDLLMLDNVFKKMKFDETTKYSKAWVPGYGD